MTGVVTAVLERFTWERCLLRVVAKKLHSCGDVVRRLEMLVSVNDVRFSDVEEWSSSDRIEVVEIRVGELRVRLWADERRIDSAAGGA